LENGIQRAKNNMLTSGIFVDNRQKSRQLDRKVQVEEIA
jgi:hypothetical protein